MNYFPRWLQYVFCILITATVVFPLYIAVFGGVKTMGQLMNEPLSWPSPFAISQYADLLTGKIGTFWSSMASSVVVAVGTVVITLVLCVMSAFALARLRFRGRGIVLSYIMLGLLFPLAVAILPLYLQIRALGLVDTFWGVILPQVAFQIPVGILLLRGFFLNIPRDLEDACFIDGYGSMGFLWKMVIPLSTPILATLAVLTLIFSWNNFFLPLLVFNKPELFTLPMGVMNFQGQHASNWNLILGFLTLAMVPAIVLFVFAQRFIVAGLTNGAVKG